MSGEQQPVLPPVLPPVEQPHEDDAAALKRPQKIAKKNPKSLNRSFKTNFSKKYLLNLNDF